MMMFANLGVRVDVANDGFQATRRIRAGEVPHRDVPIVGMSAGAMHEDRERAREAGMDDYVTKPIRPEDLDRVVKSWLGREAVLRE